jgi:hypothetical protein
LSKDEPQPIYSADPNDPWNRIFYHLFTRTVRARVSNEFLDAAPFAPLYVNFDAPTSLSTRPHERIELGDRAIDALYPGGLGGARPEGATAVLSEPRHSLLCEALNEALTDRTKRTLLARALMQSDTWSAYDVLYHWCVGNKRADQARGQRLMNLLSKFMRRIALTAGEIDALPNYYAAAAAAQKLPDLFASNSKWLEVEWFRERHHDSAAYFRRAARVFVLPLQPLSDEPRFLKALREDHRGDSLQAVALVSQLLLVDTDGKIRPTPLTPEVQVRTFGRDNARIDVQEWSRKLLLRDERSSGFVTITDTDPAYLRAAGNDYSFAFPTGIYGKREYQGLLSVEPILVTQRRQCAGCHGDDARLVLTFPVLQQGIASTPPVRRLTPADNDHTRYVAHEKIKREDFKALLHQWGK